MCLQASAYDPYDYTWRLGFTFTILCQIFIAFTVIDVLQPGIST